MNKYFKKFVFGGIAIVIAASIFTFNFQDNSLSSLSADASEVIGDTKCVETVNCDCKSPSTGTIYNGYKLKDIGGGAIEY
jgi:hypothetical protein